MSQSFSIRTLAAVGTLWMGACSGTSVGKEGTSNPERADAGDLSDAALQGVCQEFCIDDAGADGSRAHPDAGSELTLPNDCEGAPRPLERACERDEDCIAVVVTSCCGDDRRTGIQRRAAAVHAWNERCAPACLAGCYDAPGERDDDDNFIGAGKLSVQCVAQQCRTSVDVPRFPCGAQECLRGDYCEALSGGPSGSSVSSSCHIGDMFYSDCSMFSGWLGCSCSEGPEPHALRLDCAAP